MLSPTYNVTRRRALQWALASATTASLSRIASAQLAGLPGSPGESDSAPALLPYRVVSTSSFFHNRVVELFEFTCPYCRQINAGARQWGSTLPKPFIFEQVPLVYDNTSARGAGFYYLFLRAAPDKIGDYMDALFSAVQDQHAPLDQNGTYIRAAAQAGMSERQVRQALQNTNGLQAYIKRVAELCKAVAPHVTPTFVVNSYATDVSYTRGDYQKLFRLLDGLVSQQLHQG